MSVRKALMMPVVAGVSVAGFAGSALAGPPPVSIKVAKHASGPFNDLGVRLNIADGEKKTAFFKVKSTDDESHPVSRTSR